MLLALIYPIATILIIWAAAGHVGPAEAALQLKSGLPGWQRGLGVAIIAASVIAVLRSSRSKGWISWIWFAFAMILAALAGVIALSTSPSEIAALGGTAFAGFFVLAVSRLVILGETEPSIYLGYD